VRLSGIAPIFWSRSVIEWSLINVGSTRISTVRSIFRIRKFIKNSLKEAFGPRTHFIKNPLIRDRQWAGPDIHKK